LEESGLARGEGIPLQIVTQRLDAMRAHGDGATCSATSAVAQSIGACDRYSLRELR